MTRDNVPDHPARDGAPNRLTGAGAATPHAGGGPAPRVAAALAARVATLLPTPLRVLFTGETGTGKNHLAYLFRADARARGRSFVEINAANLPESLFEAELFGYRRGAFTGAGADREGVLSRADGGVLFLNEVGELSEPAQAKLLTVLDGGTYRRLGDPAERRFEARLVSATNRDLAAAVRGGEFRADLYYRLAQVTIEVPPLRQRPGDIPPLAREFLERCAARRGVRISIERRAMRLLVRDPWPGNVRELRDAIETLAFLAPPDGRIRADAVDELLGAGRERPLRPPGPEGRSPLRDKVDRLEREEILRALILAAGNKTTAARTLGVSVPGLRLKLRRLGIPE